MVTMKSNDKKYNVRMQAPNSHIIHQGALKSYHMYDVQNVYPYIAMHPKIEASITSVRMDFTVLVFVVLS